MLFSQRLNKHVEWHNLWVVLAYYCYWSLNFVALLKGKFTHPHVIPNLNYTFKDNILAYILAISVV